MQTKDEVLAELMAEHVAFLRKRVNQQRDYLSESAHVVNTNFVKCVRRSVMIIEQRWRPRLCDRCRIRGQRFIELSIEAMKEADDHVIPREIQDWGPSPEERYSQKELRKLLATSINELDPGYRIVFQLRDIEGLSTDETAQTLGLSTAAVKSRLARARMRLRNSLDVHFRATDRLPRGTSVEEASLQAVS